MNIIKIIKSEKKQMIVSFVGADLYIRPLRKENIKALMSLVKTANDEHLAEKTMMHRFIAKKTEKKSLCKGEIEIKSKKSQENRDFFEKTSEKLCCLSCFYSKNKKKFIKQEKKHINIVDFEVKQEKNEIKQQRKAIKQVLFFTKQVNYAIKYVKIETKQIIFNTEQGNFNIKQAAFNIKQAKTNNNGEKNILSGGRDDTKG